MNINHNPALALELARVRMRDQARLRDPLAPPPRHRIRRRRADGAR